MKCEPKLQPANLHTQNQFSILPRLKQVNKNDLSLLNGLLTSHMNARQRRATVTDLFDNFQTLRQIVYAPKRQLEKATKLGGIAHEELQKARDLAVALARVEIDDQPILARYDELIIYCRTFLAGERREQFHALFFDKAKSLISSKCMGEGTVDHVSVYPRELFEAAMEVSATSIILVHIHPSGKPNPSRGDIDMTRQLAKIGYYLGIPLCDHIIVGTSGTYSFRNGDELEFGKNGNIDIVGDSMR